MDELNAPEYHPPNGYDPVMVNCPDCDGQRRIIVNEIERDCPMCAGTGLVTGGYSSSGTMPIPPNPTMSNVCSACNGEGVVSTSQIDEDGNIAHDSSRCGDCDGTGEDHTTAHSIRRDNLGECSRCDSKGWIYVNEEDVDGTYFRRKIPCSECARPLNRHAIQNTLKNYELNNWIDKILFLDKQTTAADWHVDEDDIDYCNNMNACQAAEIALGKLGSRIKFLYAQELAKLVTGNPTFDLDDGDEFTYVTATARQRCEAIYIVLGGNLDIIKAKKEEEEKPKGRILDL